MAAGKFRMSGESGKANTVMHGRFGGRSIKALDNLNLQVSAGQRVGLVGRNGSGKSTLLRVIGGIYTPTTGALRVDGKVSPLFNIRLGMQPEESGRQNILLRGLVKGLKRSEVDAKIDEIIEFSELDEFIDLPLRTYSAGMAMRLSFAIATAFTPEILLLDEWIGAGDQQFQRKASNRMRELVDKAGITVVASHNRALLRRVCTHAVWLDKGKVRAFDEIESVFKGMDSAE